MEEAKMKVLLLGEFSGFFINLKNGLISNGINCLLAANGDGWKKINGADFPLYNNPKNKIKKFFSFLVFPFFKRKQLYGYDVVMLVDPSIFHPLINKMMFKLIKKHNKKIFVSVAGSCFVQYECYKKGELGYYIFDNNEELCSIYSGTSFLSRLKKKQEKYIFDHCDGIIPIMYEYAVPLRARGNCLETIPIGFDCSNISYVPNIAKNRIVIMHGIIREKSKGTQEIKDALKIIKEKYGDYVEVILEGKMPLDDYLERLKQVNILVDQCKEHCYGMNALYAMAEGRIVLGGASDNSLNEFGLSRNECPVFHITPNVSQIVEQLEYVISLKDHFEELGKKSREFVEHFHDYKRIALEYINLWEDK